MRKFFAFALLGLVLASSLPAQFITDVRPDGRSDVRVPGGRRPGHRPSLGAIRVEEHKVSVSIEDGVARTRLVQVFRNPNNMNLEGTYMFPLPEGAAVSNFAMLMGGKMVQGEVLERNKAAEIYQGIVRRQQDPALLEYMGKRLFRARVFPIPARGIAKIELSYDETLLRDGRTVEWRYPYRTRSISRSPVGQASVHVKIKSTQPVMTVYSPSHEVDVVKKGDHDASVSYETKQDPGDRDFVVVYGLAKEGAVGATLFAHSEGEEGAFMLLLAPSSELEKGRTIAKDVVFVVDTSGSMSGDKMEQTKKALRYCVNSLGEKDRFNIVPFATEATQWKESLVAASGANKDAAIGFVDKMQARGGTNINDALVSALGMSRDKERPYMIIFMTDGEPTIGVTQTKSILANVKEANKALTRLFVFGVGENLKVDLLDLLAEDNQGARDYVGSKENIEVKVSSFFEKVSSPVLADVSLEISGVKVKDLYPKRLPDLFRGAQLMVTGRYTGSGTAVIKLKGKVNGKAVEHVFERAFKDGKDRTSFVPRLWAVRKVGYLMDQIRMNGRNDELAKEIVRLGKKYGIVTPYTSYLVIEDGAVVADGRRPAEGRRRGGRGAARPGNRGFGGRSGGVGGGGGGATYAGSPGGTYTGPPVAGGALPPGSPKPDARSRDLESKLAELAKKAKKAPDPAGKRKPASTARAQGESAEASDDKNRDAFGRLSRDEEERDRAVERLRRGYFKDAIALSKEVRDLRGKRVAGGGVGDGLIRRVGNRTFLVRDGLTVESSILDLKAGDLTKRLVRIEAFSAEYFEILKRKGMGQILALGDSLLFMDGDKVVQVVPAGALKPEPEKSGK